LREYYLIALAGFLPLALSSLVAECISVIPSPRQVTIEEGEALAKLFGGGFFEVSAKRDVGVTGAFSELIRRVWGANQSIF